MQKHPCDAINEMRKMSNQHGIFSLFALSAFMFMEPGRSQRDVARITGQSSSAVGDWVVIFQLHGLIELGEAPKGEVKQITLTELGRKLRSSIGKVLEGCTI